MKFVGTLTEDQVVAEFLQGEFLSPRFHQIIKQHLIHDKIDQQLILQPDLNNAVENAARAALLGKVRGYPNQMYFENFPADITWIDTVIEQEDIEKLHFASYEGSVWQKLAGGSLRVSAVLTGLKENPALLSDLGIEQILAGAANGQTFSRPILVGSIKSTRLVVLEGHTRITAAMTAQNVEFSAITGISENITSWPHFGLAKT